MKSRWRISSATISEHWESVEIPILRPDGEIRVALWNSANIHDSEGTTLLATIAQGQDITERKEAEIRIARSTDELARSNEELQRFAYVASHDLQEPLRSIVSFSQLLERRYRGRLDEDADDYINFIVEGGTRMQALIRDLLQVSRVETNARPLEPTDAGEVVGGALRLLETTLQEAGATVTVGPMPSVLADAAQLEQVFANLIGNAIKYRHPERPPAIRVSAEQRDRWWEFAVADNGIGIEAEYFDRIFEMFRRLHTHDQYRGNRYRARRGQADRRAARWPDPGRVDAGRGLDLLLHPADRIGSCSDGLVPKGDRHFSALHVHTRLFDLTVS